jgi:hypothetical protein
MRKKNAKYKSRSVSLYLLSLAFACALIFPVQVSCGTPPWTFNGPEGGPVTCFATNPFGGRLIYAGGAGGVWKSTDSGDSWKFLPNSPAQVKLMALNPKNPSIVYAGMEEGVYKSLLKSTSKPPESELRCRF